jgi:hypothetical protein
MVEYVVDVDSINSFVVEFEVKEFARFLEFTIINLMDQIACDKQHP